jgi:hypothetical protein
MIIPELTPPATPASSPLLKGIFEFWTTAGMFMIITFVEVPSAIAT